MILSQAGDGAKCQLEKAYSVNLLFLFCKAQKIKIGVQGHMEGGRRKHNKEPAFKRVRRTFLGSIFIYSVKVSQKRVCFFICSLRFHCCPVYFYKHAVFSLDGLDPQTATGSFIMCFFALNGRLC